MNALKEVRVQSSGSRAKVSKHYWKEMVMFDRIRLGDISQEPTKEELLKRAAEKPVRGLFTIDIYGLNEDGADMFAYPDFDLRNSDIPVRVQLANGTSRGEVLFYLRELLDKVRDDHGWNYLTFDLHPGLHTDATSDECVRTEPEGAA
jgi:hypothetical protein